MKPVLQKQIKKRGFTPTPIGILDQGGKNASPILKSKNHQFSRKIELVRGFSLIEVAVGAAMLLAAVTGLVTAYALYLRAGFLNTDEVQSTYLAEEGIEAVTLIRDLDWDANIAGLSLDTPYYLAFTSNMWTATTVPNMVDGEFKRTFSLRAVYRRNNDDNIVDSGAADPKRIDAGTKKVVVRVEWGTTGTSTKELSTYLTDLF